MAQTVTIVTNPATTVWTHPFPTLPLTLDYRVVIAGGGGSNNEGGGGGGSCLVDTTPSVVTGDVNIQVGDAGFSVVNGYPSIWDGSNETGNYLIAYGGQCAGDGGNGGGGGSGTTITGTFTGGSGSSTAGGGGAGAAGNGVSTVTGTPGAGGINGSFPAGLHGGAGGASGADGTAPGGGAGKGAIKSGGVGLVAVAYTLATPGISTTSDFAVGSQTGSTATLNINYSEQVDPSSLATFTLSGNPVPTIEFDPVGDFNSFTLNPVAPDTWTLGTDSSLPLPVGTYIIVPQATGSGTFTQTITIHVIDDSGSYTPTSVSQSCSLPCGNALSDTPPQIFQLN
jgi:hypothetical protein